MIYDVCVVGSGAGAGPIIYELSRAGLKVCVLEKGDIYNEKDFSLKPTYIFSNKKILLNKNKNKNRICINSNLSEKLKKQIIGSGFLAIKKTYSERSAVPVELYRHILEILEGILIVLKQHMMS